MIISPSCQNNNTYSNHPSLLVVSQVVLVVKNRSINAGDTGSIWLEKMPWSRKWQPTPKILLGKFHGQRSLVDYSP